MKTAIKLLAIIALGFFTTKAKAQTFELHVNYGCIPCTVNFTVYDASGTALFIGTNSSTPSGCYSGTPSYMIVTVGFSISGHITPSSNGILSCSCLNPPAQYTISPGQNSCDYDVTVNL